MEELLKKAKIMDVGANQKEMDTKRCSYLDK